MSMAVAWVLAAACFAGDVHQEAKLTAPDAGAMQFFGRAVALEGDRLAVGETHAHAGAHYAGAVHVFERGRSGWSATARLVLPVPEAGAVLGSALALEGDTLVAGAPWLDTGGYNTGGVAVFRRAAGGWRLEALLAPWDAIGEEHFGLALALAGDRLLVGAPHGYGPAGRTGAAYTFERIGGRWREGRKLAPAALAAGDDFGHAVALDGNRAFVSAPLHDLPLRDAGAVFAFRPDGGAPPVRLAPFDGVAGATLGASLAVEGRWLVAGASGHPGAGPAAGAVYLFRAAGAAWEAEALLGLEQASDHDRFGIAVALAGGTLWVGAHRDSDLFHEAGALFAYRPSTAGWQLDQVVRARDAQSGDLFGASLAADGARVAVGATLDDDGAYDAGAVYVLAREDEPVR